MIRFTCLSFALIGLAGCATVPKADIATTTTAAVPITTAAQAYGRAWASRDVNAIVALHADETSFSNFLNGEQRAQGRDAVSDAFADVLRTFPNYASEPRSLRFGEDFMVLEYDILAGPSGLVEVAGLRLQPERTDYRIPAVDVIVFDTDGKVLRKNTYSDVARILANSALTAQP